MHLQNGYKAHFEPYAEGEKFRHALHLGDERRDEEKVCEAQEEKESVGTLVRQECSHKIHMNIEITNNQFL